MSLKRYTRYRHNFDGILIGTYTRPMLLHYANRHVQLHYITTQGCHFKWPWMTLSRGPHTPDTGGASATNAYWAYFKTRKRVWWQWFCHFHVEKNVVIEAIRYTWQHVESRCPIVRPESPYDRLFRPHSTLRRLEVDLLKSANWNQNDLTRLRNKTTHFWFPVYPEMSLLSLWRLQLVTC